jgi:hypothetical protein
MSTTQKRVLELEPKEYYLQHLKILNIFLPIKLTETEMIFLSCFMAIDNPLAEYDRFNTAFRKMVKKEMGIVDAGVTNYIRSLSAKKAIKQNLVGINYINPVLFPDKEKHIFQLELIKKVNATEPN